MAGLSLTASWVGLVGPQSSYAVSLILQQGQHCIMLTCSASCWSSNHSAPIAAVPCVSPMNDAMV